MSNTFPSHLPIKYYEKQSNLPTLTSKPNFKDLKLHMIIIAVHKTVHCALRVTCMCISCL